MPVVLCAHVLCVPAHTQCRACASPHFRELGANTASSMAPLSACKGRGEGGRAGGEGGREGGSEGGEGGGGEVWEARGKREGVGEGGRNGREKGGRGEGEKKSSSGEKEERGRALHPQCLGIPPGIPPPPQLTCCGFEQLLLPRAPPAAAQWLSW